ncbi:uncharacterized protein B0H18DRAFT_1033146 [Fomitopsis serialis]|uniref:uncharacterized protein n=1 Tax=Fomitopsis serialis TaxID=139415 RepID=UPI002008DD3D|nr:uncharacterized protein B0H18DRAFT_1033146 [Neoantrodia serialis]KAH9917811.1 hypothetical protein B0H18DRAFT_1033146 [Neoantrodia serialis]
MITLGFIAMSVSDPCTKLNHKTRYMSILRVQSRVRSCMGVDDSIALHATVRSVLE